MPRFLQRHQSAEFLRTLRLVGDPTQLPRSHSVRLSKKINKEKSGHFRRGLKSIFNRLESPRSTESRRSRFQEAFDDPEDDHIDHLEDSDEGEGTGEEDVEEDLTTRPSDSSTSPVAETKLSSTNNNLLSRPCNAQSSNYAGRDVYVKARSESPRASRLLRHCGSANNVRHSVDHHPTPAHDVFVDITSPRQTCRVEVSLTVGRQRASYPERRGHIEQDGSRRPETMALWPGSIAPTLPVPLICPEEAPNALGPDLDLFEPSSSSGRLEPSFVTDDHESDLGKAVERAFRRAGGRSTILQQSPRSVTLEAPPVVPLHGLVEFQKAIASVPELDDDELQAANTTNRVLKLPRNREWRNKHKNFFPPGASELSQDLVVRSCNRYIRDIDKQRRITTSSTVGHDGMPLRAMKAAASWCA